MKSLGIPVIYHSDFAAFTVDDDNPYFSTDENNVLYNKNKTILYQAPSGGVERLYIPNTVEELWEHYFHQIITTTYVSIPNSVQILHGYLFAYCYIITTVHFEYGINIVQLDDNVFADWTSLTSIELPESIQTIPSYAFHNCQQLHSIYIPSTVSII